MRRRSASSRPGSSPDWIYPTSPVARSAPPTALCSAAQGLVLVLGASRARVQIYRTASTVVAAVASFVALVLVQHPPAYALGDVLLVSCMRLALASYVDPEVTVLDSISMKRQVGEARLRTSRFVCSGEEGYRPRITRNSHNSSIVCVYYCSLSINYL